MRRKHLSAFGTSRTSFHNAASQFFTKSFVKTLVPTYLKKVSAEWEGFSPVCRLSLGMGHDQLFKRFFHEFLQDFLELFYPDVAARLDFTTLEFLDKELFTDFPEGSVREADVVARVETHEGVPELILVHIEIQLRPRGVFAYRMYQYYALFRFKYGCRFFRSLFTSKVGRDWPPRSIKRRSLEKYSSGSVTKPWRWLGSTPRIRVQRQSGRCGLGGTN
jgi:hypothetical protein